MRFLFNNYKRDIEIDQYLSNLFTYQITAIEEGVHYFYITFENKYRLEAWNANKYYAWMFQGKIYDLEKVKNKEITLEISNQTPIYSWYNTRPGRKWLRRFFKILKKNRKTSLPALPKKEEILIPKKEESKEVQNLDWLTNLADHKKFIEEYRND